eukprot:3084239-Prymnesium_polylepis.1
MEGIWKVSVSARLVAARVDARSALPVAMKAVPKRLRFIDPPAQGLGRIEVPMDAGASGSWCVTPGPPDASGAQIARFVVEGAGASLHGAHVSLLFDGLYDGERIAGTVVEMPGPVDLTELSGPPFPGGSEIGDFLCTRLFTFWGPPKPKAGNAMGG